MNKSNLYVSNPFRVIFTGFSNLFKYNQNLAIILLVVSLLGSGSYYQGDLKVGNSLNLSNDQMTAILIGVAIAVMILLPIIVFLTTMFNGIAAFTALKTSQQQTVTFKQAWKASLDKFWTLLGINVIVALKVIGGLFLLVIPGIRAALRYNMVHLFVFDQNTGVKESIGQSKSLAKDHLIEIFGMTFAAGIIPIVGGVMTIGGQSVMYSQLTTLKSSQHEKPPVHWLNYLGIIILCSIILLGILVGLAIAAIFAS